MGISRLTFIITLHYSWNVPLLIFQLRVKRLCKEQLLNIVFCQMYVLEEDSVTQWNNRIAPVSISFCQNRSIVHNRFKLSKQNSHNWYIFSCIYSILCCIFNFIFCLLWFSKGLKIICLDQILRFYNVRRSLSQLLQDRSALIQVLPHVGAHVFQTKTCATNLPFCKIQDVSNPFSVQCWKWKGSGKGCWNTPVKALGWGREYPVANEILVHSLYTIIHVLNQCFFGSHVYFVQI